jgi:hypothetical protein
MFNVIEAGNILVLMDGAGNACAKFSKAGSSLQPQGGVYWYRPLIVDKATAEEHFKQHLATAPAQGASVGARVTT